MAIRVLRETSAVCNGRRWEYSTGYIYDSTTRPPTSSDLEDLAVQEGWGEAIPLSVDFNDPESIAEMGTEAVLTPPLLEPPTKLPALKGKKKK